MNNNQFYNQHMLKAEQAILELPWQTKSFYGNFLAQTYYFVSHSTRLLARSMSHFQVDRDTLFRRFLSHMSEEDNHEKIALSDLKKLGFNLEDFPETSLTKTFWQSQYYLSDTTKGTALLGYILFLEAIAVETYPKVVGDLYSEYGKKCCQFLKVHVEEDPEHVLHAIEEIEKLSKQEQDDVWKNFEQTAEIYCEMLRNLTHSVNDIKNLSLMNKSNTENVNQTIN